MSRTKRIYHNKNLKKAQRFNVDDNKQHLFIGIPYTEKRSWICMGKCPMCRDPKREPRLVRKKLKVELRRDIQQSI